MPKLQVFLDLETGMYSKAFLNTLTFLKISQWMWKSSGPISLVALCDAT